ncbi:MAG: glycosyl hydrolase family 28-related protein, partial [Candidatus Omnitrophota bacterium]
MKIKQKYLVVILLLFFFVLNGKIADAATIRVSGNNSAAIQSALDSAASGDTVVIPAGDYYLITQVSQKNKNLNLIGEGTVNLYLQAPATRSSDLHFMGSFITNKSLGASA